MMKAIAQETLATLVETGTTREFHMLLEGEARRLTAPRRQMATVRTRLELVRLWRSLTGGSILQKAS
jgi:hypothetical protein